ncbi:MAG: tripartite tricarboxylate transporter TctB family protein [Desulfobacterales bacterium]|nr:MAG: tripartite tricarboxylate transporter TctB family protein [Desulfobacterales bacterium]
MSPETKERSRFNDLFSAFLGAFAAFALITSPWNVDTEGPDPFYKGPLIFPVLVLSMMILASLPAWVRLLTPAADSAWQLDGKGFPKKTLVVLGLLIAMLVGVGMIGLEISAWLFLCITLYYLGHRGALKLVVLPLVITGLIVLVFKHFLGVFFPTPLVVEWLWE